MRLRSLLARLAVDAGRTVSTGALVDAIWPEEPPADPAGALQTWVSLLRRTLGDPTQVQQGANGYRFALAPADLDATEFARHVASARALARDGKRDNAAAELASGLTLWRGEPLADISLADYVDGYRARWQELWLTARGDLAELQISGGQASEIVGELEELVSAHPLDERFGALLIRARATSGRSAEALDRFPAARPYRGDHLLHDCHRGRCRATWPVPNKTRNSHYPIAAGTADMPPVSSAGVAVAGWLAARGSAAAAAETLAAASAVRGSDDHTELTAALLITMIKTVLDMRFDEHYAKGRALSR